LLAVLRRSQRHVEAFETVFVLVGFLEPPTLWFPSEGCLEKIRGHPLCGRDVGRKDKF